MARHVIDPDDPRAPAQDEWDRMSPEERVDVVASLPSEFQWATPPEGDLHWEPKASAVTTLREHFQRIKRRVYLAAEMAVYYPAERVFAPDLIAIRDVDLHPRSSWVVSHERRGLDLALEIHVSSDRRKDFVRNVENFARLGIPEYFAFDAPRGRFLGWRLPRPDAQEYEPIEPREGRWWSGGLELDIAVEGRRLRFFHGAAPVLESHELAARLGAMVDDAIRRAEDQARRADDEARRAEDQARRAEDQARLAEDQARRAEDEARRADRLAQRLRELGVDPDAIR